MASILNPVPMTELAAAERIALYPAASGAHYFLQYLEEFRPEMRERIVALGDAAPAKNGLHFHGSPIVEPAKLAAFNPDAVVINSILHFDEISETLRRHLPGGCALLDANCLDEYIQSVSRCSRLAQDSPCTLTDEELAEELAPLSDFYLAMPFGKNRFALSGKGAFTYELLKRLPLPSSLSNVRVLDIGASDGFYSFECERRGAASVLAVDGPAWNKDGGLQRLLTAKKIYNSQLQYQTTTIEELQPTQKFDLILALGLYYHLKDPYFAFRRFAELTTDALIVTGRTVNAPLDNPFEPGSEAPLLILNGPTEGKWTANLKGLTTMLESAGFSRVETHFHLMPPGSYIGSVVILARK